MLIGQGAEQFARGHGLEIVDPAYFRTEWRRQELQRELLEERGEPLPQALADLPPMQKFGTVGVVALDRDGNLAAATSTGGMSNKRYGRVGDSPIIGAGTYADNDSVAVSCTGAGEFFIRWVAAHEIAALVKYKGLTAEQAGDEVIHRQLAPAHGYGGAIVLDRRGNFAMPFNTEGMYRGWMAADGEPRVSIYKD